MKPIPLIRASVILPAVTFLKQLGAPASRLWVQAKLPSAALDAPEGLVPLHQAYRFFEQAARSQGMEHFGWQVGERMRVDELGAFGRLICRSLTLYEALTTAQRMIAAFNSGARLGLTIQGGQAQLRHWSDPGLQIGRQQANQYSLMIMLNAIRLAAGADWRPAEIEFEGEPAPALRRLDLLAETRIMAGQGAVGLALPAALLSLPLQTPGKVLPSPADEHTLWSSAPARDFPVSLWQALNPLLREGYPDINVAAELAGTSVRTFQRRLAVEGLCYSRLIDQIRFERACRLLGEPDIKLIEIALELGYSDPANFTRAFQRWAGVSPRAFRLQHSTGVRPLASAASFNT